MTDDVNAFRDLVVHDANLTYPDAAARDALNALLLADLESGLLDADTYRSLKLKGSPLKRWRRNGGIPHHYLRPVLRTIMQERPDLFPGSVDPLLDVLDDILPPYKPGRKVLK